MSLFIKIYFKIFIRYSVFFFEVGIFCVPFKNEFAWAGGEGGGGGGEVR